MRTFYDILSVPTDAPLRSIRGAYLQRMKQWHPDTGASPDPEDLRLVMEAYRVLSNVELRRQYDQQLGLSRLKTTRKILQRTRTWLGKLMAPPEVMPSSKPPETHQPSAAKPSKRADFSKTLNEIKAKGKSPFVKGEDGVIRRVEPSEESLPEGRIGRRTPLKRPGVLTKPTPWKLWR